MTNGVAKATVRDLLGLGLMARVMAAMVFPAMLFLWLILIGGDPDITDAVVKWIGRQP